MNIIEDFENTQIKGLIKNKKVAQFHPGDTVRVNVKVREGARERIQAFEGVCTVSYTHLTLPTIYSV